ncbi:MAG: hypothetical protein ACI9UA_006191, partial [Pseudoalteromonas tetraodonis]
MIDLKHGVYILGRARDTITDISHAEAQSFLKGTSGNLLWKWGAEKIPAGEAINAKLSGDSG